MNCVDAERGVPAAAKQDFALVPQFWGRYSGRRPKQRHCNFALAGGD